MAELCHQPFKPRPVRGFCILGLGQHAWICPGRWPLCAARWATRCGTTAFIPPQFFLPAGARRCRFLFNIDARCMRALSCQLQQAQSAPEWFDGVVSPAESFPVLEEANSSPSPHGWSDGALIWRPAFALAFVVTAGQAPRAYAPNHLEPSPCDP